MVANDGDEAADSATKHPTPDATAGPGSGVLPEVATGADEQPDADDRAADDTAEPPAEHDRTEHDPAEDDDAWFRTAAAPDDRDVVLGSRDDAPPPVVLDPAPVSGTAASDAPDVAPDESAEEPSEADPAHDALDLDEDDPHVGHNEPATTVLRLRPEAELLRAHRRRERRRTLTFLGIFLGVLGMGLASFTFFQGTWTWPLSSSGAAAPVCPTPTRTAPAAKDVTMRVYNASDRRGLARTVAAAYRKRSFKIIAIGNDPLEAKVAGAAVIRHGPAGLDAAKTVAAQVDGTVKLVADDRVSASVDLVLGRTYVKLRSPAAAQKKLVPVVTSAPAGCVPAGEKTPTHPPASAPKPTASKAVPSKT